MAKEKVYVGSVGTEILADAGQNITGATVSLEVIKPGGAVVVWPAAVHDARLVRHTSVAGDFDVAGNYRVNPIIALGDGSWTGPGKTAEFHVYNKGE